MPPTHETSRAAVFDGVGKPLRLETFALPQLKAGEVLVRIVCTTLCGSDLHTYEGRRPGPVPSILGHEILGQVVGLGNGKAILDASGDPIVLGDRITWSLAASCGKCFFCEQDLPQKCVDLFKYGHEKIDTRCALNGGLADHCHLVAGTALVKIPDSLPDRVACPSNCATATVAAAFRIGQGCRGETVLILGAGMLGLTACAMAAASGAAQVLVADIDADRLELAQRFGATETISAQSTDNLMEKVLRTTKGRGADLALDVSGANQAIEAGLKALRIGGRLILVGSVFPAPDLALSAEAIVRGLKRIEGVHNYHPKDLVEAVAFLERHHQTYPFEELVAEPVPLEEAEQAFGSAAQKKAHRISVVP